MMFDYRPSYSSASAVGHPEESSHPDISEHLPGVSCDLQWYKWSDYFWWNRQRYQGMFSICVISPFDLSPLTEVVFSNFWDCDSFALYTNYKEDSNLNLVFFLSYPHWLLSQGLHYGSYKCHQGPDSSCEVWGPMCGVCEPEECVPCLKTFATFFFFPHSVGLLR